MASVQHDVGLRHAAKQALLRPAVQFTAEQRRAIAEGFGDYSRSAGVTVWACAVMPDHVHLVVARHRIEFSKLIGMFKTEATRKLCKSHRHPFQELELQTGKHHTCWGERGWTVFLYSGEQIADRVAYVQENPPKAGLPRQDWKFVVPFSTPH